MEENEPKSSGDRNSPSKGNKSVVYVASEWQREVSLEGKYWKRRCKEKRTKWFIFLMDQLEKGQIAMRCVWKPTVCEALFNPLTFH